jgi:hypothetical protein
MRRFADTGALHPMEFLKQIEKYTFPFNVPDETMIDFAVNHLEGAPQDWATALSDQWATWEDFREAFLTMYWSLARQDAIVAEFANTMYNKCTHHSMTQFLIYWMGKVKFLTPPIEPARFMRQFIHLLPANTFNILATSNVRTTTELLQVLQIMDEGVTRRGHRQAAMDSANRQATQPPQGYVKQSNQPHPNTSSRGFTNGTNNSNNRNSNSNWRKPNDGVRARVNQIGAQNVDEDLDVPRENDDDHETSGNEQ